MTAPLARLLNEESFGYAGESAFGALSLKTMRGTAHYWTGQARHRAGGEQALLLNEGTSYRVEVEPGTRSFCIFLNPGVLTLAPLAEDAGAHLRFLERTLTTPPPIWALLGTLRTRHEARTLDPLALDTLALRLLDLLVGEDREAWRAADGLPALSPARRAELARRLFRARDTLDALALGPVGLGDAARASGLSPAHLARGYARLFGETPLTTVTRRRMAEARRLLEEEGLPVAEVTWRVGYASVTTFTAAYARWHGQTPGRARRIGEVGDGRRH